MKRIVFLLMLGVVAALLIGAAATTNVHYLGVADRTIDSQHTGNWELIGQVICVSSDTAVRIMELSAVALMDPWDVLYVGFGNDSANRVDSATSATTGQTNSNLDTLQFQFPLPRHGKARIPICARYIDSVAGATTDTVFFNLACGGSSGVNFVHLEDIWLSVTFSDGALDTL